ncbi:hypothetical protein MC7420_2043 [Coleofasciculus chthonoplastes PCC 7420]|uniref:Uncharacterized protein n=1 Tax=Coleofasciculus chthonoplastes PCC 7420 TaxID=118168 RepID=B4VSB2_9CYAN|nr:hypothetical protein MC7420_2043 [Coleofasciculus chthonoplastes PCC 7420]
MTESPILKDFQPSIIYYLTVTTHHYSLRKGLGCPYLVLS